MTHDRDLYELARLLIATRGGEAEAYATAKLEEADGSGNADAYLVWKLIIKALRDLSPASRTPGEPLN